MSESIAILIFEHYGKVSDRFVNICERNHFPVDNHRDHVTVYESPVFLYTPLHLRRDRKLLYPLSLPTQLFCEIAVVEGC
jgi:hypothetical protein